MLAAPILNKLSSSPDVLSNASGGQLNVGIGSSIGAEVLSTVFDTNSRSITLMKQKLKCQSNVYYNMKNNHDSYYYT